MSRDGTKGAHEFRVELIRRLDRARQFGVSHLDVNAGELHRYVGGYPARVHAMPLCAAVMMVERRPGDEILVSAGPGREEVLTIRYRLPR